MTSVLHSELWMVLDGLKLEKLPRACNIAANFMAKWVQGAGDGLHLVKRPSGSCWRSLLSDLVMAVGVDIVE
ncbi:hypothetical protein PVK06_042305 [Gossypium arboreum]|uniref:Uncharacterized protein n=1 Tax=Gossypium arboreum TaxID=29729 RepID=A0ABR0MKZ0_GOSAR|nr:hypothetical protein PVK06_042305 [Gossypium arboreum]